MIRRLLFLLVAVLTFVSVTVLAQAPGPALLQQYSEQGQQALAHHRYPEAEAAFEKLRDLSPRTAEVHAQLGLIYFQEKKFEPAVMSLRQALKLKPSLPKLDTLLAMSLSELGRFKEALPGLEKGFKSTDPAVKRMCGLQLERAYSGLQQDRKAVEVALQMSQLYAKDPEVLYHGAKIFGNFAFLSIQQLAKVDSKSVWTHQAAAEANEAQGNYDFAIAEYRQVLAADPNRAGIHYQLGRTLLARSRQANNTADVGEAVKEFEQELQVDPTNASAAYEVAEIKRQAGQLQEAQQFFERALQYYPEFTEAQLGLGAVLMAQQKPGQALPHFQQAVASEPSNEVSWYRLALAERAVGNESEQEKAMAEFRRLHEQASQQRITKDIFSPEEVTRQQLDSQTDAKP